MTANRKARLAGRRAAVYRFFDSNEELLYLGITHNIDERWGTHERIQPWWLDVARREFTWYETRAEAEQIEASATVSEKPRYDRSGQRTTGGEVDRRLNVETERAMQAVAADIDNGTYPLWRVLPSYGALSRKYQIPVVGITRGLSGLAHREKRLVYHQDQFAVSRPDCVPSRDAKQWGLLFFLASNAFGDSSFMLTDLAEMTGFAPATVRQYLKRWQTAERVECVGQAAGGRALTYRIIRHPEPDSPKVLTFWSHDDVLAIAQWLNQHLNADAAVASDDPAARSLVERDREIVAACLPNEYGVSRGGVRVLKVMARRYFDRPGCLPEWGITEGAAPF
ncbi:GIY-YIG nuclease family protein [Streptomyces sp. BE133]|uniref:GIY-YIG nuclease family protein n=1 Tax=Streptomyces sp. BE133 TaxID=3002523 RepID=UPI002E771B29|nr:GIY-YIG nuclease family protein [Streptomyces sp. BE133]MEE1812618.1 GIY-YIG nuclease family protein [Streptomyces sp. BE133]